jgi:hypothetical protein
VQQRIEIEFYPLRSQLPVDLETLIIHVGPFAIVLPILTRQRIRVGPLQGDTVQPQGALCLPDGLHSFR